MKRTPFTYYPLVILGWIRLLFSFRPLRFISLETDQRLLYEDTTFYPIWDVRGAYIIKLYYQGKLIGSHLPNERVLLPVFYAKQLTVVACGAYRRESKSISLAVHDLTCKSASGAQLTSSYPITPAMIKELVLRLKYQQPVTPTPVIHLPEITLDTPFMNDLKAELQERITVFQENLIMKP